MSAIALVLAATMVRALAHHPPTITNPDWVRKPLAEEIAEHYPKLPQALGVEGMSEIRCDVAVSGQAENCKVVAETPKGLGFGQAALAMTPTFRFSPKTIDGKPVEGGIVTVPIRFSLDLQAHVSERSSMPHYKVDDAAKALARHLADLMRGDTEASPAEQLDRLAKAMPVEGDPDARRKLIEAYKAAFASFAPLMDEKRAEICAELFTPDQMRTIIAFLESDAGKAFMANGQLIMSRQVQAAADLTLSVATEAMRTYCATSADACASDSPPPNTPAKPR